MGIGGRETPHPLNHSRDPKHHRHAELVSASMPRILSEIGTIQLCPALEAWVLKQVQDDGEGADERPSDFAPAADEEGLDHA
jgi:hypothetical protein